jgi:hypothetical protein
MFSRVKYSSMRSVIRSSAGKASGCWCRLLSPRCKAKNDEWASNHIAKEAYILPRPIPQPPGGPSPREFYPAVLSTKPRQFCRRFRVRVLVRFEVKDGVNEGAPRALSEERKFPFRHREVFELRDSLAWGIQQSR